MVVRGIGVLVAVMCLLACGETKPKSAGTGASGGVGGEAGNPAEGGSSAIAGSEAGSPAEGGSSAVAGATSVAGQSGAGGTDLGGAGHGGESEPGAGGAPGGTGALAPVIAWSLPSGDALNATPPVLAATRSGMVVAGATSDLALAGVTAFPTGVLAEAFVAELARDGSVKWSTPLPDAGMPSAVVVEENGDVLVLAPFIPDATSLFPGQYADSVLLARLDASGDVLYERELAFGTGTIAEGLAVDAAGAIYVAGSQIPEDDFPNEYVLFAKYDAEGLELWTKVFEHEGSTAYASSVTIAAGGDAVIAGVFNGSMNLGGEALETDALLGTSKMPNGFVARFNAAGDHVSSQSFGGTIFDGATALQGLDDGDVLLGGWLSGVATVGGQAITADEEEGSAFLARLDAAGAARWVSLAAATGATYDIVTDSDEGAFFVAGELGASDYLAEITASGEPGPTWTVTSGTLIGRSAAVDAQGSVWLAGDFVGELDLGNGNVLPATDAGVCLMRMDRAPE
jgi:hypothetical protein